MSKQVVEDWKVKEKEETVSSIQSESVLRAATVTVIKRTDTSTTKQETVGEMRSDERGIR